MQKKKLPPEALELLASRFKMLAEPMRLRLLQELQEGELNVTQLVEASGASQANVSKHLGLLVEAGMVSRRKDGLNVYYMIADPFVFELCELVCSRLQREFGSKAAHFEV